MLPLGDEYITRDLAIVLKTSIEEAGRIKEEYGAASPGLISEDNMVAIKNVQGKEAKQVSQQVIAEIINARVIEMAEMIYAEIKRYDYLESIPGGMILTGGGAELAGLADVMEEYLGIPVRLGMPENIPGLPAELNRPQYAAVLGGVIYASQYRGAVHREDKALAGIVQKVNYWLKDLFS